MILDEIVRAARRRESPEKYREEVQKAAKEMAAKEPERFLFEEQLRRPQSNIICEVKKASPSKGVIDAEFDYINIAKEYEKAGAAAISVLTEPEFFKGSIAYLAEISRNVSLPILRKDFIIHAYQIYEAKANGASAVLLICSILEDHQLERYIGICDRLHLSALVEVHNSKEVIRARNAGARVIGVNNRNLEDFTVDICNSIRLRRQIPKDVLFVAESGIKEREDIRILERVGANGVLIGETMMRAVDKRRKMIELTTDLSG